MLVCVCVCVCVCVGVTIPLVARKAWPMIKMMRMLAAMNKAAMNAQKVWENTFFAVREHVFLQC